MGYDELPRLLLEHIRLTAISVTAAAAVGIPFGILLAHVPAIAGPCLGLINICQTLPSLALLGFLIPLLGIGVLPAVTALFLYALLPIVRATYTGVRTVGPELIEVAEALGMTALQRLRHVELPLAVPHVLAGLRTSTVINVGTATLSALIGAGGLGEPIFRGIATVNSRLILMGAIPAAGLALTLDGAFALLERVLLPRGLSRVR
jgi:osmoprotectant transport system permease protein